MGVNQQFMHFVGRTSACNWPVSVVNAQVVAEVKPDYEKIANLKPDLILVDKQLYSEADLAKIKSLGAKIFEWDPKSLADYRQGLIDLSSMVGGEVNTSTYLDKVDSAAKVAKERLGSAKPPKIAIILPDSSGKHMWLGTESFQAEEVKAAELDLVGPKGDRFVPLDAEALIKGDPDFVLIASKTPDDFLKDVRFAQMRAVKNGKAFGMNPDLILRRGGRVDLVIDGLSKKLVGAQ